MTDAFKAIMDEWQRKNAAFLEACARVEASPNNSDLETELDKLAAIACRETTPAELAILAFPAIEPDDVRAKARWIVKEFEDCTGFTDAQADALMAGWRATAET